MSRRQRRLLLLSSSSLFWLSCMLTVAPSQPQQNQQGTPQSAPPAAPTPTPAPAPSPAPAATPPDPVRPAPTPPPRTEGPSVPAPAPAAPAPTTLERTQTFDRARDNIFAPLATPPSTLSSEAIEALPQGTNATVRDVLLQLPGVTQDSAQQGGLHVRNEHAYVSTAFSCPTASGH